MVIGLVMKCVPAGSRRAEACVPARAGKEKGSDVNLSTYLLAGAFLDDADAFVTISNDSDLTEPMRIVRHELGRGVGILNPHPPRKHKGGRQNRELPRAQAGGRTHIRSLHRRSCHEPCHEQS